MSTQCYANIACLKNTFGSDVSVFHRTWLNILNSTSSLPNDTDFIDINPGIIINGANNTVSVDISQLRDKILGHTYTKKLTIIATPVFFFDFANQGHDRNHFCALYITIDKAFGPRGIPKISINYFNPHGIESSRITDEILIVNTLRKVLLEGFSKQNNSIQVNIRTHIYNGVNLQSRDPMGMCIFYGFTILSFFMQTKISNTNIHDLHYNITINQLVDELLDTFLYEDHNNCNQLHQIAEIIAQNLINPQFGAGKQRGGQPDIVKVKQLINYISYDASTSNLQTVSEKLKLKSRSKVKLLKKINKMSKDEISKLYKFIFKTKQNK